MSVSLLVGLLPYWNYTNIGISPVLEEIWDWERDWQTYKKSIIIWKNSKYIEGMSPKKFRKISPQELEISLLTYFSKKLNQLTDWQTHKKFRIILKWCNNIPGTSLKIFRKIYHSGPEICLYLSNFSKEVSQLTDIQVIQNYLEMV